MRREKKIFGTDGIRGKMGHFPLTLEYIAVIARVVGYYFFMRSKNRKVLLAMDTRISGPLIAGNLIGGFVNAGFDVEFLDVFPTPGLSYLLQNGDYAFGVMISASHNPYEDNGIKIFDSKGMKLSDEEELEIEDLLAKERTIGVARTFGKFSMNEEKHKYINFIYKLMTKELKEQEFKIVIDCANGAMTPVIKELVKRVKWDIKLVGVKPDGKNINKCCGSTHLEMLIDTVVSENTFCGVAFDGDGDRVIFVDKAGHVLDGDYILYYLAMTLKEEGKLKNNTVVGTVMSNMALEKKLKRHGIKFVRTDVGDRYVLKSMLENNYNLGGEQSGHIILLDYSNTGDGLLTAINFLNRVVNYHDKLSEIYKELKKYPQKLYNIKVDSDKKSLIAESESLKKFIEVINKDLKSKGRIFVRASGTEALIRVMCECKDIEKMEESIKKVSKFIDSMEY